MTWQMLQKLCFFFQQANDRNKQLFVVAMKSVIILYFSQNLTQYVEAIFVTILFTHVIGYKNIKKTKLVEMHGIS